MGNGVVEDIDEALHFLGKAADQGYVRAIRTVGYMYQTGWKVPQDFVLAHKWYNIAASLGDEKSRLDRDEVARLMTPGQIAEAQKLVREWVASQRKK
jgi:TPR repeat protein